MNPANTKLFAVPNLFPLAQPIDVDASPAESGMRTTVAAGFMETRHGSYRVRVPRAAGVMVSSKSSGEDSGSISADAHAIFSDSRKFGQDVLGYDLARRGRTDASVAASQPAAVNIPTIDSGRYRVQNWDQAQNTSKTDYELKFEIEDKLGVKVIVTVPSSSSPKRQIKKNQVLGSHNLRLINSKIIGSKSVPAELFVRARIDEVLDVFTLSCDQGKYSGLEITVYVGAEFRNGVKLYVKAVEIKGKNPDTGVLWDSCFNANIPLVDKGKNNPHLFDIHIGKSAFQVEYTLNTDASALELLTLDENIHLTVDPIKNYLAALIRCGGDYYRAEFNETSEMLSLTSKFPVIEVIAVDIELSDKGETTDIKFPVLNVPNFPDIEVVFAENEIVIRQEMRILDQSNDAQFRRIDAKTFIFNPDFDNPYAFKSGLIAVHQLNESEFIFIPVTADEYLGVHDVLPEPSGGSQAAATTLDVEFVEDTTDHTVDALAGESLNAVGSDHEPVSVESMDLVDESLNLDPVDNSSLLVEATTVSVAEVGGSEIQQWHRDVVDASGLAPILDSLRQLHDAGVIGALNLRTYAGFFDLLADMNQVGLKSALALADANPRVNWSLLEKKEVEEFLESGFDLSDFDRYASARRAGIAAEDVKLFFESNVDVAVFNAFKQDLPFLKKAIKLGIDRDKVSLIKTAAQIGIADADLAFYLSDPVEVEAVYQFAKQTGDVSNYKWIYQISGEGSNVQVFVDAWVAAKNSISPELQARIQELAIKSSRLELEILNDLVAELKDFKTGQQNLAQALRRLKYF